MKKLVIKRPQKVLEDVDLAVYLRKYIQSYLYWIYQQNKKFAQTLTIEEISNFFFDDIKHPIWFIYLLQTNSFKICTEVNNYISRYKKNAELMEPEIAIIPRKEIAYTSVGWPVFEKANTMQKERARQELQPYFDSLPESLTAIDSLLIHEITIYNQKKRGASC